jgi:hypothetical protein
VARLTRKEHRRLAAERGKGPQSALMKLTTELRTRHIED